MTINIRRPTNIDHQIWNSNHIWCVLTMAAHRPTGTSTSYGAHDRHVDDGHDNKETGTHVIKDRNTRTARKSHQQKLLHRTASMSCSLLGWWPTHTGQNSQNRHQCPDAENRSAYVAFGYIARKRQKKARRPTARLTAETHEWNRGKGEYP
jgi:hypothetical protein